jgi:hypothetical protein
MAVQAVSWEKIGTYQSLSMRPPQRNFADPYRFRYFSKVNTDSRLFSNDENLDNDNTPDLID